MADIAGYLDIISKATAGESVRDAIINCMRAINADAAVKPTSLIIKKADNVTYKPGVGKAFKSVTVNIDDSGTSDPEKTITYQTLTVDNTTENGTYPPDGEEDVAYNQVVVEIDWEALIRDSVLGEEAHVTSLEVDPTTKAKYWDASMAGYDYVKRIWIDTDTGLPTYGPGGSPGGYGPGDGKYKCTFNNRLGAKVFSIDVPAGTDLMSYYDDKGNCIGDKIEAIKNDAPTGKIFQYWKGLPTGCKVTAVTSNFTATPYYDYDSAGGSIGGKGWAEVLKNSKDYAIGETITLTTLSNITIPEKRIYGSAIVDELGNKSCLHLPAHTWTGAETFTWVFQIVAHGAYGTDTTFLAKNPIGKSISDIANICGGSFEHGGRWQASAYGTEDITMSVSYKLLEYLYEMFPTVVKSHIQSVDVKQYGLANANTPLQTVIDNMNDMISVQNKRSQNLWLPSVSELYTLSAPICDNQYVNYDENGDPTDEAPSWHWHDESFFKYDEITGTDFARIAGSKRWFPNATAGGGEQIITTRSSCVGKFFSNTSGGIGARGLRYNKDDKTYPYDYIGRMWREDDFQDWYIGFHVNDA